MEVRQFIIDGEQIDVKDVEARENIGDLSELETTAKDSLVSAINELENAPTGISDYNDLSNKPSINGVTLSGNKTTADLNINAGIESYNDLADKPSINNVSLVGDVDSSDLNIDYDDLSNRPVESGNVDMDSIVDPLPPIATEEKVLIDERGTEYTIGWYVNSSDKRKPVYQKTVLCTTASSITDQQASIKSTNHNISNIDYIVDTHLHYNTEAPIWSTNRYYISAQASSTTIDLICNRSSLSNINFYVTLQYTKTSDSWEDIPS